MESGKFPISGAFRSPVAGPALSVQIMTGEYIGHGRDSAPLFGLNVQNGLNE